MYGSRVSDGTGKDKDYPKGEIIPYTIKEWHTELAKDDPKFSGSVGKGEKSKYDYRNLTWGELNKTSINTIKNGKVVDTDTVPSLFQQASGSIEAYISPEREDKQRFESAKMGESGVAKIAFDIAVHYSLNLKMRT